jgi:hypothetical protein
MTPAIEALKGGASAPSAAGAGAVSFEQRLLGCDLARIQRCLEPEKFPE